MRNHRLSVIAAALLGACAAPETAPPAQRAVLAACTQSRFEVRGDAVHDKGTRLTWHRCLAGQVFNRAASRCEGSIYATEKLGSARRAAEMERQRTGQAWRLPTIDELETIGAKACAPLFRTTLPDLHAPVWTSTRAGPGQVYQFDVDKAARMALKEDDAPAIVVLVRD